MDCLQSQRYRCPSGWRTSIGRELWCTAWDNSASPARFWLFEAEHRFLNFLSVSMESFPFLPSQRRGTGSTCRESAVWSSTLLHKATFNLMWLFSFGVGREYDVFVTYSFSLFMKLNHKWMLSLWREAGGTEASWHGWGSSPHTSFRKQLVSVWFFPPSFVLTLSQSFIAKF